MSKSHEITRVYIANTAADPFPFASVFKQKVFIDLR